jgi:hypothetical protein
LIFRDCRGLELTAASDVAVARFDETVAAYLGLKLKAGDCLKATLEADREMPLALILRGYFFMLMNNGALAERARKSVADATAAIEKHGASERERAHLAALAAWTNGYRTQALGLWERILADHPRDAVALRLSHFGHFYSGSGTAMRDSMARALAGWSPETPGYGFFLGCLGFSHEEAGEYRAGEKAAREATERNPEDVWSAHAVAHVMEMEDRPDEGIAWINSLAGRWGDINPFIGHVWWHRALFHLDREEVDAALAQYDSHVWPAPSDEYLDFCNAASMLCRIEDMGGSVGDRWQSLADKAMSRIGEKILIFGDLHYALALAGAERTEAVERCAKDLRECAAHGDTDAANTSRACGADIAEAFAALSRGEIARTRDLLAKSRARWPTMGGSRAQRDVFERLMIVTMIRSGADQQARPLLEERRRLRPGNAWARQMLAQLDAAGSA